ncbi:arabinosyltransferase XEG113-like isoform X2 [Vigna umbellata]|uniref:arabinosyltransferase XEG113-like isoform X2 n=1 Tax=Vigna umbellata TaxID=87088 RepID=UPI001F5ECE33|nr:arabinosyltransferase XEG113-like isoform X2 [Vigna umbellata]
MLNHILLLSITKYIKQIRTALAIASLLNRTLVMPPLWCRIDRLWYGHPGILEGSMTRQPFLCPLDHVFEVNVMLKKLSEEEFGPQIDFREYSILDNPSLPSEVERSWLDVQLCKEGTVGCDVSNDTTSVGGILKFPKHSNEETFMKVFSSFKDIKVIKFSSVQDAFQGFTDKEREDKFRNRVKRYVGIWCCVPDQSLGHIYYDMYWDEKPGWKAIPPQTSQDDHPPW